MANFKRTNRFNDKDGTKLAQVDREFQNTVDLLNRHNSGLVGWDNLSVKDGSNKRMGVSVLVGGTVTVANTSVTANSRIFHSRQVAGGTLGHLSIGTVTAGVSFVINSSNVADTSTINWLLVEPK